MNLGDLICDKTFPWVQGWVVGVGSIKVGRNQHAAFLVAKPGSQGEVGIIFKRDAQLVAWCDSEKGCPDAPAFPVWR